MLVQKLARVFYSCCLLVFILSIAIGYQLFNQINLIAKLFGLPSMSNNLKMNNIILIAGCINIFIVLFNLWFTHINRIDLKNDYSFKIPLLNFIIFLALALKGCIVGYLGAFLYQSSSSYGPGPFDTFLIGAICSLIGYAIIIIQSHETFVQGWNSLKKILNVLAIVFISSGLTSLVWFIIQSKDLSLMFQQTNYWTMFMIGLNSVIVLVEWWYIQSRNCNMNQTI